MADCKLAREVERDVVNETLQATDGSIIAKLYIYIFFFSKRFENDDRFTPRSPRNSVRVICEPQNRRCGVALISPA